MGDEGSRVKAMVDAGGLKIAREEWVFGQLNGVW